MKKTGPIAALALAVAFGACGKKEVARIENAVPPPPVALATPAPVLQKPATTPVPGFVTKYNADGTTTTTFAPPPPEPPPTSAAPAAEADTATIAAQEQQLVNERKAAKLTLLAQQEVQLKAQVQELDEQWAKENRSGKKKSRTAKGLETRLATAKQQLAAVQAEIAALR